MSLNDPILVQPTGPMGWMPPETVDSLIEALKIEGFDVRISYDEIPGGGMGPTEVVLIWLALKAGKAVVGQVVESAAEWMRERFRQDPKDTRTRGARVILYEGDEGEVSVIFELKAADEEPVRRSPEDFERYTQKKTVRGHQKVEGQGPVDIRPHPPRGLRQREH